MVVFTSVGLGPWWFLNWVQRRLESTPIGVNVDWCQRRLVVNALGFRLWGQWGVLLVVGWRWGKLGKCRNGTVCILVSCSVVSLAVGGSCFGWLVLLRCVKFGVYWVYIADGGVTWLWYFDFLFLLLVGRAVG